MTPDHEEIPECLDCFWLRILSDDFELLCLEHVDAANDDPSTGADED